MNTGGGAKRISSTKPKVETLEFKEGVIKGEILEHPSRKVIEEEIEKIIE